MGEKIRILYIIDNLGRGGAQKHLLELINRLDKNMFDITIAVLSKRKKEMIDKYNNNKLIFLDLTKIYNFDAFKKLFKFRSFVKQFDIVHTYLFSSNVYGVVAAKLAGVKNIITSRRAMTDVVSLDKRKIEREIKWQSFVNRFTSKLVCVCEAVKRRTLEKEKISKDKLVVIQNGIDLKKFDKKKIKRLNKPVVGIVTHLTKTKDIMTFLDAVNLVNKKIKCNFVIIGDGNLRRDIEKKIKEENIKNINLLGEKADAINLIKSFDIGVNSSILEGSANTILEYMSASLPVIATNVGGNPELVVDGKTGIIVPSRNPEAMADAIVRLLEDKNLAKKMGKEGRKRIEEKFSVERMVKRYGEFYGGLK